MARSDSSSYLQILPMASAALARKSAPTPLSFLRSSSSPSSPRPNPLPNHLLRLSRPQINQATKSPPCQLQHRPPLQRQLRPLLRLPPQRPANPRCPNLVYRGSCGYTVGMKTAISIPDDLFEGAERLARRTKRTRSRLFSDALKEYLARHAPDRVTSAMNQACAEIGDPKDSFVSSATSRSLERSEW